MASETTPHEDMKLKDGYPDIHEQQKICRGILSTVKSTIHLDIKSSTIQGAGSGLFAAEEIEAGEEIFRSYPLVSCRDPHIFHACDFCFKNSDSALHPEGRFLSKQDKTVIIKPCTGCRVARYCSSTCQKKAWNRHHKHECKLLRETPTLPATTQALYRLLLLDKEGKILPGKWAALIGLEASFLKHTHSENDEDIMYTAMQAGERIGGLKHRLSTVWRLYCQLLTNCMNICLAGTESSIGCSLDLVVATMNHNCNPNALVFFEGNQVRVRTLRKIYSGGEIFVSYVDPRMDVLRRQDVLKKTQFIDCQCNKCSRELSEHREVLKDESRIRDVLRAQTLLAEITHNASQGFYVYCKQNNLPILEQYVQEIDQVTNRSYANKDWPGHIEPLPLARMEVARMYTSCGSLVAALNYGLKGCLLARRRKGAAWVADLLDVGRVLEQIGLQAADSIVFELETFPTRTQIRIITIAYMQKLCLATRKSFGLDTTFTQAVLNWADRYREIPGQPPLDHPEFERRFKEAEVKLLNWAGIGLDKGLEILSKSETDFLTGDMKKLSMQVQH